MYELGAVRTVLSDDESHFHIDVVGYRSPHIQEEVIFIDIPRVLRRIAMSEFFYVQVGDDRAEVSAGKCPDCGFEPYLKTTADSPGDQKIISLPAK